MPDQSWRLGALSCLVALLTFGCASFPGARGGKSQPPIPDELVGVWVAPGSEVDERGVIHSGLALYLLADGRGAAIGAPPPVGYDFLATFDPETGVLSYRFEIQEASERHLGDAKLVFDREKGMLRFDGSAAEDALTRRSEEVSEELIDGIGIRSLRSLKRNVRR